MRIYKAPIADVVKYITEIHNSANSKNYRSILQMMSEYYCSLSNRGSIVPLEGTCMADWCEDNYSDNMTKCPRASGILLQRQKNNRYEYGLTCLNLFSNELDCFVMGLQHSIYVKAFDPEEWDFWGAPVRYFQFRDKDYKDAREYDLGERILYKGDFGHDVKILQHMLARVYDEVPQNGVFDKTTLEAYQQAQTWCGFIQTNYFCYDSDAAEEVLEFLNNGR